MKPLLRFILGRAETAVSLFAVKNIFRTADQTAVTAERAETLFSA